MPFTGQGGEKRGRPLVMPIDGFANECESPSGAGKAFSITGSHAGRESGVEGGACQAWFCRKGPGARDRAPDGHADA
jgi:hypothetical protein